MAMDSNRTVSGVDKPRVSTLYKSIVGFLVLANLIAGVGLIARALSDDDATSVAADGVSGVALNDDDGNDDDDAAASESAVAEVETAEAADDAMSDEDMADDAMSDEDMADDAMVDEAIAEEEAMAAEEEDALPLEPGIDPAFVLDSVDFIESEDGETGPASMIDTASLWTGSDLPTEGLVRTQLIALPEPLAEIGTKYSADWQIHSLTTGELVESTFDLFATGQLPVFDLGDHRIPMLIEDAMIGNPIDSDYLVVYPLGMEDLPDTLAADDAYVAFVQIYRFKTDADDDDAGASDAADAAGNDDPDDAGTDDADAGEDPDLDAGLGDDDASGADDDDPDAGLGDDESDDPGPNTDDSPDDDDPATTGVEDTEGGN